jgi:SAM-dependent methyltransferase
VAGFATAPPNETLMQFAAQVLPRAVSRRLLDIGCGAGRNAVPLARSGWRAEMQALPLANASVDLVVAHGIWNLARSARQFRTAVADAARVARPGAALFVFTFSRTTLRASADPVAGEPFVYTQFSGEPQCFLTEAQLADELGLAGFARDPALPLEELNTPRPGAFDCAGAPVIYQGGFRRL